MSSRAALTLTTTILLLLLPTGCGGGGHLAPQTQPGPAEQLVDQSDISRYGAGTPAHTLFTWWRASQFADRKAFLGAFIAPVRAKLSASPKTPQALVSFAAAIRSAKPRIMSSSRSGGRATLYTKVVFRQPVGTKRYISFTAPRAFTFEREAGAWLLTDDLFVQSMIPVADRRTG